MIWWKVMSFYEKKKQVRRKCDSKNEIWSKCYRIPKNPDAVIDSCMNYYWFEYINYTGFDQPLYLDVDSNWRCALFYIHIDSIVRNIKTVWKMLKFFSRW